MITIKNPEDAKSCVSLLKALKLSHEIWGRINKAFLEDLGFGNLNEDDVKLVYKKFVLKE
jgi:hypothetical protein